MDNAKVARDRGADGLVVSDHGDRQPDGVLSSTWAVPDIGQAVDLGLIKKIIFDHKRLAIPIILNQILPAPAVLPRATPPDPSVGLRL